MESVTKKVSIISGNTINDCAKKTGCTITNTTVARAIIGVNSFLPNKYVAQSVAIEINKEIVCNK